MTAIGNVAFEGAYAMLPDLRCSVRVKGKAVITRALCSGIMEGNDATEQGLGLMAAGNLRFLEADEPSGIKIGDRIEVKRVAEAAYQFVRVAARVRVGGMVRLGVEGVNQV
jgi:hypothetical protein